MATKLNMMRSFDVWRHSESPKGVTRYRCFEHLGNRMFCVQNSDFYPKGLSPGDFTQLDKQFVELLLEEDPFSRSGSFSLVEDAIKDHDETFNN